MTKVLTITSGKGGVGKTSISLNLALSLAAMKYKVCLFDADLGLANVNILTGIYPQYDLESVISHKKTLDDIIIKNYHGIDIIPGSSGVQKMADLSNQESAKLVQAFVGLKQYDYLIFDTSAGISSQVLSFCLSSNEIILVMTKEPTSITDGYSMLKVLSKKKYQFPVKVVFNQVPNLKTAQILYAKLKNTVNKYLNIKLVPLGLIASDKNVQSAILSRTPFLLASPNSAASRGIKSISQKLLKKDGSFNDVPIETFWQRCMYFMNQHGVPKIRKQVRQRQSDVEKPVKRSNDALAAIEAKISNIMDDIFEVKSMIRSHLMTDGRNEQTVVPWASTRRISDDPDSDAAAPDIPILNTVQKRKAETIARGKLRTPTPEELVHWDEMNYPVLENQT